MERFHCVKVLVKISSCVLNENQVKWVKFLIWVTYWLYIRHPQINYYPPHVYWLSIYLTLVYWFKKTLLRNKLPSHTALQRCKSCWRLISLEMRNKQHFRLDHHLDHKCKVSRVGTQQAGLRFSPQKYELRQCLCADRSRTRWAPEEAKKETNPEPLLQAENTLVMYFWPKRQHKLKIQT